MSKLKIIEHLSLDGVIQAPGGPTERHPKRSATGSSRF